MPLNFPDSPSLNQVYTSGSNSWQWDGTVWNALSSSQVVINGSGGATGAIEGIEYIYGMTGSIHELIPLNRGNMYHIDKYFPY